MAQQPRRQHFIEFLSPGTLYDETSSRPVESWDIATAVKLAKEINERHGAKPYGFTFRTDIVAGPIDDGEGGKLDVKGKTVETSGIHYIDGEVIKFDDLPGGESTLRSNMRGNRWPLVCETRNSYRHTGIFTERDRVVSTRTGGVIASGSDAAFKKYRADKIAEWEQEK